MYDTRSQKHSLKILNWHWKRSRASKISAQSVYIRLILLFFNFLLFIVRLLLFTFWFRPYLFIASFVCSKLTANWRDTILFSHLTNSKNWFWIQFIAFYGNSFLPGPGCGSGILCADIVWLRTDFINLVDSALCAVSIQYFRSIVEREGESCLHERRAVTTGARETPSSKRERIWWIYRRNRSQLKWILFCILICLHKTHGNDFPVNQMDQSA